MIAYNWKAEFSQEELVTIKWWKRHRAAGNTSKDAIVITEMTNALDRYEAILNEMEGETMTVNIYQSYGKFGEETVILCTACYKRWNPAGAIRKIVSDVMAPCEMCQPDDYGKHLEDMRRELDSE